MDSSLSDSVEGFCCEQLVCFGVSLVVFEVEGGWAAGGGGLGMVNVLDGGVGAGAAATAEKFMDRILGRSRSKMTMAWL